MLSAGVSVTAVVIAGLSTFVAAQFPPAPEGVTVLESRFGDGVTISYKEPGICETTPGVKSYAGYIHLPPGELSDLGEEQDYPINTFFWFFEARKDPENAPLSIWLNGGPGSTSMVGLFQENGPCFVNWDSNSTYLSEWAWNREVNMLFVDQPTQVGLSYDTLHNVTLDLGIGETTLLLENDTIPEQNTTLLVGTLPSQQRNNTAQGSRNAAIAIWHFAQTWFQEFPGYHPNDSRVSIATESYGGRYGPAFASFFAEQNRKIENGTWHDIDGENYIINLDTLFLINSCIDRRVQWPSYAHIAYNNTYGIEAVNETVYGEMVDAYERPGGCRDQIDDCRALAAAGDPDNRGANATVNAACQSAETFCTEHIRNQYTTLSGRNYYDMATVDPDPFPAPFYAGYLNQAHVQRAVGAPLNFTPSSGAVAAAFRGLGDYPRAGWLEDLASLLDDAGVKVHLVYGDRDFACNWLGGEAASLAIPHAGREAFRAAGYADLVVNGSYVGGQVRQRGNLSFTRVYQAGHEVPAYQPETAYRLFSRALFNRDLATGTVDTGSWGEGGDPGYATEGPPDTWATKNELPPDPVRFCYVRDLGSTCTGAQYEGILNGSATIRHGIVVDQNSTALFPGLLDDGDGDGDGDGSGGNATITPSPTPSSSRQPGSASSPSTTGDSTGVAGHMVAREDIQTAFFWTLAVMVAQAILA
ncbi:hypothetical protein SLS62_010198 [Diatrype stigma]|uniref:Carboxypeptidase n=1 Tax=Diatrype stigma TaxID=117547 RepID=A0AAN9YGX9_9PEZI